MTKAPRTEKLEVSGPAGKLEALLEVPADASARRIAILCHPHPQHQGTMQNKVVHTMARALNDLGMPALRFNFRGVGDSAGEYADGDGELDDLVAVADFVRERWNPTELWLGGFSFGAVIAARAATQVKAARLVTIAPAVSILGTSLDRQPDMPWLILQGDQDDIVPIDQVIEWVDQLDPGPELVVLTDVGHFFHGHLVELRQTLVANLGGSLVADS
jgi:alpha/beta superfamily hydrolase